MRLQFWKPVYVVSSVMASVGADDTVLQSGLVGLHDYRVHWTGYCGSGISEEPSEAFPDTASFSPDTGSERSRTSSAVSDSGSDLTPDSASLKVYFIRHAESTWNEYERACKEAKKGGMFNSVQIALACVPDLRKHTDAELSDLGVLQAQTLQQIIFGSVGAEYAPCEDVDLIDSDVRAQAVAVLSGQKIEPSFIATSNLRRAHMTCLVSLLYRFMKSAKKETIHILSDAQEYTLGVDGQSSTPAGGVPEHSTASGARVGMDLPDLVFHESKYNFGNANSPSLFGSENRLDRFCTLVLSLIRHAVPSMILTGHSYWFQKLFVKFLSEATNEVERRLLKSKIANTSVVQFTITRSRRIGGGTTCSIEPGSTYLIAGRIPV